MPDTPAAAPLDVLAFGAHPDDIELFAGSTLALLAKRGRTFGMIHMTRGECGTRGSAAIRAEESKKAAEILGAQTHETLDLGDGRICDSDANRKIIVEAIRRHRPQVVMTHYLEDRHPDHPAARELVRSSCFLANVGGYAAEGERHKIAALVYFYGHERRSVAPPDWIVDISETHQLRIDALHAYGTQFGNSDADDPAKQTYISSKPFWDMLETTAKRYGHFIGAEYGEAFAFQDTPHANHPFVRMLNPADG